MSINKACGPDGMKGEEIDQEDEMIPIIQLT